MHTKTVWCINGVEEWDIGRHQHSSARRSIVDEPPVGRPKSHGLLLIWTLSLPKHLKIFNSDAPTIVLTPLNILSIMRMANFLVTRLKTM